MRIAQDLVTTNNAAHLSWEIDDAGVSLAITRPPEGVLFEEHEVAGGPLSDVPGATPSHAELVRCALMSLRIWLDAFQIDLVGAMQRIAPMLCAPWPEVANGSRPPGPARGTVELYTAITANPLDHGESVYSHRSEPFGLWWIVSRNSLAVSVDVGCSRRRRSCLWHRSCCVEAGRETPGDPSAGVPHVVGSAQDARVALIADLTAWADSFRLETTGVAERLGQTLLSATGRGE